MMCVFVCVCVVQLLVICCDRLVEIMGVQKKNVCSPGALAHPHTAVLLSSLSNSFDLCANKCALEI